MGNFKKVPSFYVLNHQSEDINASFNFYLTGVIPLKALNRKTFEFRVEGYVKKALDKFTELNNHELQS